MNLWKLQGGGVPESKRASELSELLGIQISRRQVLQGHSPFKEVVNGYENELIVAVGKGEPAAVMSEYGFKKVLSMDEYASCFKDIDPLSHYKTWRIKQTYDENSSKELLPRYDVYSDRVKAAFVVSDPIDWGRDIQVLCDILRFGGLPGRDKGHQPPIYFASDDLEYQAAFPTERLGMGAFRIALEGIFNSVSSSPLKYTSFGKPNPFVFKNAEVILTQLVSDIFHSQDNMDGGTGHEFSTLYMIGDNPKVDINGAMKAGRPWFSILTRTGVFRGKDNDTQFPADLSWFTEIIRLKWFAFGCCCR
ncbi:cardiolipin synthase (CMP-forming) / mitochondrial hydrolase fusion protein isoform X3 [Elaeis guineensis]|uniref:cardiolipin synthase (CMP-forming) / mitochondrial hydrolase fusion protein isoform X3 n=1 Tax=Elaeis guineensis var. tenera TaxID=51953 RepID=UPI00057A1383